MSEKPHPTDCVCMRCISPDEWRMRAFTAERCLEWVGEHKPKIHGPTHGQWMVHCSYGVFEGPTFAGAVQQAVEASEDTESSKQIVAQGLGLLMSCDCGRALYPSGRVEWFAWIAKGGTVHDSIDCTSCGLTWTVHMLQVTANPTGPNRVRLVRESEEHTLKSDLRIILKWHGGLTHNAKNPTHLDLAFHRIRARLKGGGDAE